MPHRFFAPPTKQELYDIREALNRWSEHLTKIYRINNMKKKLVIKFWRAERALAMQIVEQKGLPINKTDGRVKIVDHPELYTNVVALRGNDSRFDYNVVTKSFKNNDSRDDYFDKIKQAITSELFTEQGELKVGEMCEFRIDEDCPWKTYKMLAILPEGYGKRYIASICEEKSYWMSFREARPIGKHTKPKVETNGEIVTYTWEE